MSGVLLMTACSQSRDYFPQPLAYQPHLVPQGMLVHNGVFSADLQRYYYTLSDSQFSQFDVMVVERQNSQWSTPQKAFFNSSDNEHGMSFSADGNTLYFSYTRPVQVPGVADTWHLFKAHKVNGQWQAAQFIDIKNLRHQLMMLPTVSADGTLYFHAGPSDYSELNIYQAKLNGNGYDEAHKLPASVNFGQLQNTALIAPDQSYILFEAAGELHISRHGRGNPYITPDGQYLFFVAGVEPTPQSRWSVFWISTKGLLP